MKLAIILLFILWSCLLARLFIDIDRANTVADEYFSIGGAIVWGGVGIVGIAYSFHFWGVYE